jgi:hypothetical protein
MTRWFRAFFPCWTRNAAKEEDLSCSFCGKPKSEVKKLERDCFRRSRIGIPDSGAFLIQDAGWEQEASMDGEAFID